MITKVEQMFLENRYEMEFYDRIQLSFIGTLMVCLLVQVVGFIFNQICIILLHCFSGGLLNLQFYSLRFVNLL